MFVQAWNIYLPVIKILIKKASSGEQRLGMNKTDFERSSGGRKAKFNFSFTLQNNRMTGQGQLLPPAGKNLLEIIQNDYEVKQLLQDGEYQFTMTSAYELLIRMQGTEAEKSAVTG